jgi:chromosome segregation ATPase
MSESSQDRLERIEALVEKIGQRVDSNARAIQALTENDTEAKKERARLYQIMSDLAQAQATLAQAQADNKKLLYSFMENVEEQQEQLRQRQAILEEQQQKWIERQDTLEEQQQRLIQTQADIAELLKFVITNKT